MGYNLTNFTNANNIYEMYFAMNMLSGDWIAILTLTTIFFVLTIAFTQFREDMKESVLAASFIITVLTFLFWALKLVEWYIISLPLVIFFAMVIMYSLQRN